MSSVLDYWSRLVEHRRWVFFCRSIFILGAALFALWMVLHVVFYPTVTFRIMEDSYFFTRYAHDFLHGGVFAWNAGEPPTFGNTAQLYQLFTTLVFWLTGEKQITTLLIGSVSGGIAAVAAILAAYWHLLGRQAPRLGWIMLLALLLYMVSHHSFLRSMDTGMETGWAMAASAAAIWAILRLDHASGRAAIAAAALLSVLLYLLRPDAILMPLITLGAGWLWARERLLRRRIAATLAAIAVGLLVVIGLEWLYYGTPFPLSIYAKIGGLTIYPPTLLAVYHNLMSLLVYQFVQENVLLLAPLCMALMYFGRMPALWRAVLVAAIGFFGFHLAFTIPIMSAWSRFLMPALPLFILLAMRGVHEVMVGGSESIDRERLQRRMATPVFAALVLALLVARLPMAAVLHGNDVRQWRATPPIYGERPVLEAVSLYFQFYKGTLPQLAAALTPNCSVASTEHGRLSALLLDNRMIDLAGLHDPNIALHGFSADLVLTHYRPDVLFAPHTHYIEWTRLLLANPILQRDYAIFPLSHDEGHLVALRKDSPCFDRVRPIYQGIADRTG
jgi:hypothetical protein